jgi:hypothetical protein
MDRNFHPWMSKKKNTKHVGTPKFAAANAAAIAEVEPPVMTILHSSA